MMEVRRKEDEGILIGDGRFPARVTDRKRRTDGLTGTFRRSARANVERRAGGVRGRVEMDKAVSGSRAAKMPDRLSEDVPRLVRRSEARPRC